MTSSKNAGPPPRRNESAWRVLWGTACLLAWLTSGARVGAQPGEVHESIVNVRYNSPPTDVCVVASAFDETALRGERASKVEPLAADGQYTITDTDGVLHATAASAANQDDSCRTHFDTRRSSLDVAGFDPQALTFACRALEDAPVDARRVLVLQVDGIVHQLASRGPDHLELRLKHSNERPVLEVIGGDFVGVSAPETSVVRKVVPVERHAQGEFFAIAVPLPRCLNRTLIWTVPPGHAAPELFHVKVGTQQQDLKPESCNSFDSGEFGFACDVRLPWSEDREVTLSYSDESWQFVGRWTGLLPPERLTLGAAHFPVYWEPSCFHRPVQSTADCPELAVAGTLCRETSVLPDPDTGSSKLCAYQCKAEGGSSAAPTLAEFSWNLQRGNELDPSGASTSSGKPPTQAETQSKAANQPGPDGEKSTTDDEAARLLEAKRLRARARAHDSETLEWSSAFRGPGETLRSYKETEARVLVVLPPKDNALSEHAVKSVNVHLPTGHVVELDPTKILPVALDQPLCTGSATYEYVGRRRYKRRSVPIRAGVLQLEAPEPEKTVALSLLLGPGLELQVEGPSRPRLSLLSELILRFDSAAEGESHWELRTGAFFGRQVWHRENLFDESTTRLERYLRLRASLLRLWEKQAWSVGLGVGGGLGLATEPGGSEQVPFDWAVDLRLAGGYQVSDAFGFELGVLFSPVERVYRFELSDPAGDPLRSQEYGRLLLLFLAVRAEDPF